MHAPMTTAGLLWREERGAVTMIAAFAMAIVTGMAALALDGLNAYTTHEKLRTAAESAATAGVHAVHDATEARRLAVLFAEKNRPEGAAGAVVAANQVETGYWSKTDRTFTTPAPAAQPANAVRATASLTAAKGNALPTWFGRLLGVDSLDVSASAVAILQAGTLCIVSLDPTGAKAISLDSNASIDSPNCQVHVASTSQEALYAKSNAKVTSSNVCVGGGYKALGNASIQPQPETLCETAGDPFEDVPEPDLPDDNCKHKEIKDKTETLAPGCYLSLKIDGNSDVTFSSGEYKIKGPFTTDSNTKMTGDQVGFYLTGSDALLDFSSNTQLNFTSPRSGPLAGFIFFQDRNFGTGKIHHVDSNMAATLDGAIYFPKAKLDSNSNATWGSNSSCLMIVTHSMHFDSNSGISMNPDYAKCPWMQDNMKRSRIVA